MWHLQLQAKKQQTSAITRLVQFGSTFYFRILISVLFLFFHLVLFVPIIFIYLHVGGFYAFIAGSLIAICTSVLFASSMAIVAIILCYNRFYENFQIRQGILVNCIHCCISVVLMIANLTLLGIMTIVPANVAYYMYFALGVLDFGIVYCLIEDLIMYVYCILI